MASVTLRNAGEHVALALVTLYLVWGSTYLAMRVAIETLPPLAMAGARFIVAGLVLLVGLRWRAGRAERPTADAAWPTARQWGLAVPIGALLFLVGNGLVVVAERTLSSSLVAVVCATTPLIASGIVAIRGDRPSAREVFGMGLGFAGVVILVGGAALGGAGVSAFYVVLAPIGWALGSTIARRTGATGFSSAAAQMILGGVWMLAASVVMGESFPAVVSLRSALAWVYLIVFGSLLGFSAYIYLLRKTRPAIAFSYAYVNPVIAVLLGALLGGEAVGWSTAAATVLIAAGVMAAVISPRRT
jgi:drug/metabolite transporter (DMT)-like permease